MKGWGVEKAGRVPASDGRRARLRAAVATEDVIGGVFGDGGGLKHAGRESDCLRARPHSTESYRCDAVNE